MVREIFVRSLWFYLDLVLKELKWHAWFITIPFTPLSELNWSVCFYIFELIIMNCVFFINWLPDLRATTKPIKSKHIKIQNLSNHIKSKPIHNKPYSTTKRTHQNKTNQNKKPIKSYQIKTYKKYQTHTCWIWNCN